METKKIQIAQWELSHKLFSLNLDFWGCSRIIKDGVKYLAFKCEFRHVSEKQIEAAFPQAVIFSTQSQYAPEIKGKLILFPRCTKLYMVEEVQ
jgi:hypothetical protein